jgi:DNA mismatch repair protein MutS2
VDDHTLEKLEFDQVRQLLARQAQTQLGRQLALKITPSRRLSQVQQWRDQADQFLRFVTARGLPPFGDVRDVRELVRRAVPPSKLEPMEFADVAATIRGLNQLRRHFDESGEGFELVIHVVSRIGDFTSVAARIEAAIDGRGKVRDEASERLGRVRKLIEEASRKTKEVFDRLLRQQGITRYLQYSSATIHDERMVLPLKAEQRGRISGIVHRTSDSGQTLFVEPAEAVELNNERVNLLQDEREEINRILWELTHLVHLNQQELLRSLEAAAVIDLLIAKTKLAQKFEMVLPEIREDQRVHMIAARNPILLAIEEQGGHASPAGRVVPIDVRLGEDFDIMIVTGPNTGGKTATIKTVGLLALMAQAGLPIPAAPGAAVPVFQGIWIDVGDEQSLEQSLSTFSAHLTRILDILKRARKGTLVLLDELGAGTDPDEGAAIGRAVVDQLLEAGCIAIVTTHLGALKALGYETKRVDNASVQFDLATLRPTYELKIGEPGNSNAIAIASRLGMPRKLVEAAKRFLSGRERALNKAIAGTLESRREAERARRDADQARQDAARATLAALDRAKLLEEEHARYRGWVDRVLRLQPRDEVYSQTFQKKGRIVRVNFERQQASVNLDHAEVTVPLTDLKFDE